MTVNGALRYLHADQLGSTVLTTYTSGERESERGYYAFGSDRRVAGTPATDHRFTGQKVDGTGLYYYNARYYDPVIGQFVSPDSIVPEPNQVFAYNRYMYVLGNPLKYTDPTGHRYDPFGVGGGGCLTCVIAAAAFVGGSANATGNIAAQVTQNWDSARGVSANLTDFNKTEAGIAFGFGAAGGAMASVPVGSTLAVLANGALGAMQEVTTDVAVDG